MIQCCSSPLTCNATQTTERLRNFLRKIVHLTDDGCIKTETCCGINKSGITNCYVYFGLIILNMLHVVHN